MMFDTGSILDLLGEIDLETCSDEELDEAQTYLTFLLLETEDLDTLEDGLSDVAWTIHKLFRDSMKRRPLPPFSFYSKVNWIEVKDGDRRALALYERHYSSNRKNAKHSQFVGPGEKLVLITPECNALFAWRLEKFRMDDQWGLNCAVFRNESNHLSSALILEAEECAYRRWPGIPRMFTFVDPSQVKSTNPGYCFQAAGWHKWPERTSKGLIPFVKAYLPLAMATPWTTILRELSKNVHASMKK